MATGRLARIAACLALALPAAADPARLTCAHPFAADDAVAEIALAPWARGVSADSGGTLAVELAPRVTGLSAAGLRAGEAACALVPLPRPGPLALPFLAPLSAEAASRSAWEFLSHRDWDGLVPVAVVVSGARALVTRDGPLPMPGEIAGLRLAMPSAEAGAVFAAFGARPVVMTRWQAEAAYADGEVDGALLPWAAAGRLAARAGGEVTGIAGDRAAGASLMLLALSRPALAALPAPARAALEAMSGEGASAAAGRALDRADAVAREATPGPGLTEAQVGPIRAAGERILRDWLAAAGPEAAARLADLRRVWGLPPL
jgi:TRAP-type C4-dicarboxylate transport system substrate-binding protein